MLLSEEQKTCECGLTEKREARGSPTSCPSQRCDLEKITQPVQTQVLFMQTKDILLLKGRGLELCFPEVLPDIWFCIRT